MGNNDLEKMCREIYFKHQKALDLIFEYKPDLYSEIAKYIEERINTQNEFELDQCSKTYVRFISRELDLFLPKVGNGWTKSKRILLWEFQNRGDKLVLKLIIGPGSNDIREKIYSISESNKPLFKSKLSSLTGSYTQIYSTEILPKNFLKDNDDLEAIKSKIQKRIQQLFQEDIKKINNLLVREFNSDN